MLLNIATDRWRNNRFTGGKEHKTLLLLVPQRQALSVIWWFCGCTPIDLLIKMAAVLVQIYVILNHWVLLHAVPVSCVTHSWLHYACLLGHVQVLCGSCAGAYSIGRSAAFRQGALLHLRVLCVISSRRSLLYTSLLVQVSHSFLPKICLVNFSIDTWIPRICTDFDISTARSFPFFLSIHGIV